MKEDRRPTVRWAPAGSARPEEMVRSLYRSDRSEYGGTSVGHLETQIQIAAGYQFREAGVMEHLRRIAAYAGIVAEEIGWADREIAVLQHASVFHDVGMVDVPETIVNKQDALTETEIGLMRKHTTLGHALLEGSGIPLLELASVLAWCHHEHWDGSGYPQRLAGRDIPMAARILTVADVFDALTTDRPFKEAYPPEVAFEILGAMSGAHFDPEVADAFVRRRDDIDRACRSLATEGQPERRGFRISARDRSQGELFSIASEGYFSCPACSELHPRVVDVCPVQGMALGPIHKLSGLVLEDKYKLREALGLGGMGVVYEAEHVRIGRKLAIKFLDPTLAREPESLERFMNEARIFSTVEHPNVVEVTDFGETAEGIPYMVMELLEGIDLAHLVFRRKRIEPMATATLVLELLRTLEAVHEAGIIHRDLKPENIYIVADGNRPRIKLLDFGISRIVNESADRRLTQKGVVFGTPQYMSPEQALGLEEIDHRSDLFTVGEIMWEMLTGDELFSGRNNLAILSAVTKDPIPRPSDVAPPVPGDLEAIVMKALERPRESRYQSASMFRHALMTWVSRDPRWSEGAILDLWDEDHPIPELE